MIPPSPKPPFDLAPVDLGDAYGAMRSVCTDIVAVGPRSVAFTAVGDAVDLLVVAGAAPRVISAAQMLRAAFSGLDSERIAELAGDVASAINAAE